MSRGLNRSAEPKVLHDRCVDFGPAMDDGDGDQFMNPSMPGFFKEESVGGDSESSLESIAEAFGRYAARRVRKNPRARFSDVLRAWKASRLRANVSTQVDPTAATRDGISYELRRLIEAKWFALNQPA